MTVLDSVIINDGILLSSILANKRKKENNEFFFGIQSDGPGPQRRGEKKGVIKQNKNIDMQVFF